MANFKNLKLPCIGSPVLHGKFQMSQFAMHGLPCFTWQISKISNCHAWTPLFYMANFRSPNLPCMDSPVLHGKFQKSQFAMHGLPCFTWQISKISNCHALASRFYMANFRSPTLPCIGSSVLHGKFQMSQFAMHWLLCFTWQISNVPICHVLPSLFYMANFKNLKLPCITSPVLHGKFQKSQIAMYWLPGFTWQISKISNCHVLAPLIYMANFKSSKLPCIGSPVLHGKFQKSQIAMYWLLCFTIPKG